MLSQLITHLGSLGGERGEGEAMDRSRTRILLAYLEEFSKGEIAELILDIVGVGRRASRIATSDLLLLLLTRPPSEGHFADSFQREKTRLTLWGSERPSELLPAVPLS